MDSNHVSELPPHLLARLPTQEKLLLAAEILGIYCRVRLKLARSKFPVALAALRDSPPGMGPPDSVVTYMRAARLARAAQRTLRFVPADSRCLMQSLVLTSLLARRGITSSLSIGVNPGRDFKAHAWVEYSGRPLLPNFGDSYHLLTEL